MGKAARPFYYEAVKRLITGVAIAAFLASSAAAAPGGVRDDGYIELCGPSGCARTTNQGAYAQFKDFLPDRRTSQPIGFPPAVQPYYTVRAPGLKAPAVFLGAAGQLGVTVKPGNVTWTSLGTVTLGALKDVRTKVKPFPAPLPSKVTVNRKSVRVRPVYRHLLDGFPRVYNVQPSRKPWVGVTVAWPRGTPWPALSFSLRRGTRVMLRSDYAVRISKALARRIEADVPKTKP
jgi:hypothetical protein